ncbi:MAG: peptidylprolyl isomerase [Jaaginema sp. PMC 1079.18]|nr:peptidylprolyl isomerase [Jaaginema sp. PMC 1080.18]MEC4852182.1 peptidylprolyl isomerase [Jaaginema sp. PMC 1079.18]MEC4865691.1 peptidylprolyl isomerase [Jaaginema sp. PMC 1078.18]
MKVTKHLWSSLKSRLWRTTLIALLLIPLSLTLSGAWWGDRETTPTRNSQLAQGNAITDPTSILRYALPIDNDSVRDLQESLEDISEQLRGKRWSAIDRDIKTARRALTLGEDKLLASIPPQKQTEAQNLIAQLTTGVEELQEVTEAKDKEQVWTQRRKLLNQIAELEELMVQGFPFDVPEEYANLPQLKGRAVVEMKTTKGDLIIVADGYSAPVNAGNFVDLVERDFYDDLEFLPSQDYVLQVGDPPGDDDGFIDPNTGEYRAIPLEVLIQGEDEPIYGITLEDLGLYLEPLALPFSAYGTVALARPQGNVNGGSSQIFFFLFDSELTPPGFNLLDGRYSVLGYVVEGKDVLENLKPGDRVLATRTIAGLDNLVQPQ